jgi:hypothetical protein
MTLHKKEVVAKIREDFPELLDMKVNAGRGELDLSIRNKLSAYLVYKNTIDEERRLITFFHPVDSAHYKLLPFYVVLALYKKEIIDTKDVLDLEHINDNKGSSFYMNGSLCRLKYFDFETEKIVVKTATSNEVHFDLETFLYMTNGKESLRDEVRNNLLRSRLQNDQSIDGLLSYKRTIRKSNLNSGVIIFTQKSKFESLLRVLKIGGGYLTESVHVKKAVWIRQTERYRYDQISIFNNDAPLILVANYQDTGALPAFQMEFPNLNTVVFDDADSNWEKITSILPIYQNYLDGTEPLLRDVYLISGAADVTRYYSLKSECDGHYWLTTDIGDDENKHRELSIYGVDTGIELIATLRKLKQSLRGLYDFGLVEYLKPLYSKATEIENRVRSFYDPPSLTESIQELANSLNFLLDYGLQEIYVELKEELARLEELVANYKTNELKRIFETLSLEGKNAVIVSSTRNAADQDWLICQFPELDIREFVDFEFVNQSSSRDKNTMILSFGCRRPYSNTMPFRYNGTKEIVLLFEDEYYWLKKKFNITLHAVNYITKPEKRGSLLNLSEDQTLELFGENDIPHIERNLWANVASNGFKRHIEKEVELPTDGQDFGEIDKTNDVLDKEMLSLDEYIFSMFSEENISKIEGSLVKGKTTLIFEDGGFEIMDDSRMVYLIPEDDGHATELSELRKSIKAINVGDELIWFNPKLYDELMDLFEEKINEDSLLKIDFAVAEEWRLVLNYMLARLNSRGITNPNGKLAEMLEEYLGVRRANLTINNWSAGYTRVPDLFDDLLFAINELIEFRAIFQGITQIASIGATSRQAQRFKSYYSQLPNLLRKWIIAKKYNIPLNVEKDIFKLLKKLTGDLTIRRIKKII